MSTEKSEYLGLKVSAANRTIGDLLLYAVPLVARSLHDPPMRGHGLLTADHHRLVEVGIDEFALVERRLDPLPSPLPPLV
jgi:hypothetical protein